MLRSIRARMTAVFSLSVALAMLAAGSGLVLYARSTAERNAATVLDTAIGKVEREVRHDKDWRDPARLVVEAREDLGPNLSFFVVSRDGRVLHSSGTRTPAPVDGDYWRTARMPFGEGWVVVAMPWTATESGLRSLTISLGLLGLLVVALVTAGAWILVGRTLSPIGLLSRQAHAATIEDLQVRLREPSQDAEIVGLVATLNGLLSRLSETASAKARFYAAASHELRTPLQALSGHLELAAARERTPEEYRSAINEAYGQTRRLIRLTQNLLLLYQLEASASTLPDEPGDLALICGDALAQQRSLVEERGLQVELDLPASAAFRAPAAHMDVLARNLVENAVRYADLGTRVTVSVQAYPGRLEMAVFNVCSVPPDWESERFGEPFARRDCSRSGSNGGTGLGLAICKAIADTNGWVLSLATEPGGVRATLIVPTEQTADSDRAAPAAPVGSQ